VKEEDEETGVEGSSFQRQYLIVRREKGSCAHGKKTPSREKNVMKMWGGGIDLAYTGTGCLNFSGSCLSHLYQYPWEKRGERGGGRAEIRRGKRGRAVRKGRSRDRKKKGRRGKRGGERK